MIKKNQKVNLWEAKFGKLCLNNLIVLNYIDFILLKTKKEQEEKKTKLEIKT